VAVQGIVGSGLCFHRFEANRFVDADTLVTVSIAHHVARAATIGCAAKMVRLKFSRGAALAHEAARRERNVAVYRVVARDVEAAQLFFDAENAIFKRRQVRRVQEHEGQIRTEVGAVAQEAKELFVRPVGAVSVNPVDIEARAGRRVVVDGHCW
jgi:hypothetical protein